MTSAKGEDPGRVYIRTGCHVSCGVSRTPPVDWM